MTVNKSQGQTLQKMGLILDGHQCFSHGQVYVAMSRVTSMQGIRVLSEVDKGQMSILNIVYEELLDGVMKKKKVDKPTKVYARSHQSTSESDSQSNYDDYYNDQIY